jgi:hypothetical protein
MAQWVSGPVDRSRTQPFMLRSPEPIEAANSSIRPTQAVSGVLPSFRCLTVRHSDDKGQLERRGSGAAKMRP